MCTCSGEGLGHPQKPSLPLTWPWMLLPSHINSPTQLTGSVLLSWPSPSTSWINSLQQEIRKHHCNLYKAQASVVSEEASLTSSWLDSCSDGKRIFLLDANSKGRFEAAESDMAILTYLVVSQQDQISCKACLWGRGDILLFSLEHLYVWRQQRLIP